MFTSKDTPFFINSLAAENLTNAVFVSAKDRPKLESLLKRKIPESSLYFWSPKLNINARLDEKVNHKSVSTFIKNCMEKFRKLEEKVQGPMIKLKWNANDNILRTKFYDMWFQAPHSFQYFEEESAQDSKSTAVIVKESRKIQIDIDDSKLINIFSKDFKEDL